MTLVVCFANEHMPVIVSDIMTSFWSSQLSESEFPSVRRLNVDTGIKDILYHFDDCQKIVEITEGFFLAWCGSVEAATKVITYAKMAAAQNRTKSIGHAELASEVFNYKKSIFGLESKALQLLALFECDQENYTHFRMEPDAISHDDFGCAVTTMGSGTTDFWEYMKHVRLTGPGSDSSGVAPPGVEYLYDALKFMFGALAAQSDRGFGLDKRWGLGVEVVVRKNNRLQKLDRILAQRFTYKLGRNYKATHLRNTDASYQFYDQDHLYVFRTHFERPIGRYIVRSPSVDESRRPLPTDYPSHPQIIFTMASEVQQRVPDLAFLNYNESGDRSACMVLDPFDEINISYDSARVRQLIRSKLKGGASAR